MCGELTLKQMRHVLTSALMGRIGCFGNKRVYVVPITFAFHEGYIYGQSRAGLKINLMRKNPSVCFQTDEIDAMNNWRSVIVWGEYEEITKLPQQRLAAEILSDRTGPYVNSETLHRKPAHVKPPHVVEKKTKAIYFRIKISEMTGRFEKPEFVTLNNGNSSTPSRPGYSVFGL